MVANFSRRLDSLNRSFSACYRLLERPRAARRAVVALLVIHSALLAYSAYVHSPTVDEPAHLVAGIANWKFGRFDVYVVNPPLVKMVAALPLMAADHKEDWSRFYGKPGARSEFNMGEDFIAANGERSFFLFMISRWACIPFGWIGGVVCYLWARDLYGKRAGVVACTIWCFEPNILAHASLISPDAHAAALGLAANYVFWRWLKRPTWHQAALTAVVLGVAELAKTTLIILYPLWPIMWVAYRWPERFSLARHQWLREAGILALLMAIGLYVLNLGYGFEQSLEPLGNFHFVSELLTGNNARELLSKTGTEADPSPTSAANSRISQFVTHNSRTNRFKGSWLEDVPCPFPKNYLLGIDLQQRDFESKSRLSFIHGEWRKHGIWYYYLYAAALKVPLGIWSLALLACSTIFNRRDSNQQPAAGVLAKKCRASRFPRFTPTHFGRDDVFLLFPSIVIFSVISAKSGINEHMRYVLPCFPFCFIFISRPFGNFLDFPCGHSLNCKPFYESRGWTRRTLMAVALLLWACLSSVWIYPHSLAYFNECTRGPNSGPLYLMGSNFDWQQDLRYLDEYLQHEHLRISNQSLLVASYSPDALLELSDSDYSDENGLLFVSRCVLNMPIPLGRRMSGELARAESKEVVNWRIMQPAIQIGYTIVGAGNVHVAAQ